ARGAEDDERAGVGGRAELEPLEERVPVDLGALFGGGHQRGSELAFARSRALIAWPPNCSRSAAATLAENLISSREAKRAKSDAAITGAGTFSSIASRIVQRPSPESSTHGATSSSLPPCRSKAACRSSRSHERTTEP